MQEKKESSNTTGIGEHMPSSCKLMFAMLSLPPKHSTPENLARAYFACNHRLEINPYSHSGDVLFVTPQRANELEAEIKRLTPK